MTFDINYFMNANPSIVENDELREPQVLAYVDAFNHFKTEGSSRDAIIILPTGAGKTGVMALVPYGICKGRVLIITPQLVIKDHVVESLDPSEPGNFWLKRNVFTEFKELPIVNEYDNDINQDELVNSNIVILNIHKLTTRFRNSLLNRVDADFFDMIIIDEAHHSPAETWQNALNYFSKSKVIKVTGTPFRTDRKPIEGKIITDYGLGRAMQQNIVKSLENFKLLPEKVYLTIDNDFSIQYTIEQLRDLGIKDENYIARSVALSKECNEQIINESISALNAKRLGSEIPHKIIAVACSIDHGEVLEKMYEEKGLRARLIHSDLDKDVRRRILVDVENNRCDVIVHVAMLGEGYDHIYLSVAAIFRPFKSLAPYSQFIGRILRFIDSPDAVKPSDNIGTVIAHRDLGLEPLWKEYQRELKISEVIRKVKEQEKAEKNLTKQLDVKTYDKSVAEVELLGELDTESEYYLTTALTEENEKFEAELRNKIDSFKNLLPNTAEEEIRKFIISQEKPKEENPLLKSPKKYRMFIRKEFHENVYANIPARLISEFGVEKEGREFAKALPAKYFYLKNDLKLDNAALVTRYLNEKLKEEFGSRDVWALDDYFRAQEYLGDLVKHLAEMIQSSL
ncbi:DEAD/DEAH box helicase [Paenibacillus sp. NFR01]|uniref:DEAD/DEAH box helicase n=1 Tax=Paenibacillus sp. NFR01 TaxID=1566279 RepID=UPI0008CF658D|nr:DEAD/DEAH box helicase family protein [Paenibacillus sp. NFR01]SET61924.1 Superfamily II DNA or RNA helicase [Paenibacillus sp. NFR01]